MRIADGTLCLLILGCSGSSAPLEPDVGPAAELESNGVRELLRADSGTDGGKPDSGPSGPMADLITPRGPRDGGQDSGPVDGGYDAGTVDASCAFGWFDCDGEPGCEWDGCEMVYAPNVFKCEQCGDFEVCGCGPLFTSPAYVGRCNLACPGR